MTRLSVIATSILITGIATVALARDRNVAVQFQRLNPCPSTGERYGACPGWQKDHVVPLCMGGADATYNMQWLTVYAHSQKTKIDVRDCSIHRRQ